MVLTSLSHPHAKPAAQAWRIAFVAAWLLSAASAAQAGRVVVLLSADVPEYQKAVDGFKKASEHDIVDTFDMRGDFDRAKDYLSTVETRSKPDLIYAVGIWALQAAERAKLKTSVVYSMVLNPPSVVEGKSMTGASMNVSVEETFKLLKQLNPELKKIGTLYNPETTGFLIEKAEAAAKELGVELVSIKVESPRDAVASLTKLQRSDIDVMWLVPDRQVVAPTVLQQVLLFSYRTGIPVIGLSERHAEMGSLLSVSFASSEDIGSQAGEIAKRVLAGQSIDDVKFTTARKLNVIVNLKSARKLGIKVPDAITKSASKVID